MAGPVWYSIEADLEDKCAQAWHRYLTETRDLAAFRYEEYEPRAWRILKRKLRKLEHEADRH